MNQVAKDFVSWMLAQRPLGFEPTLVSEREVKILTDTACAEVTLWPDFNDGDICEMRIERIEDAEQVFFLHFMLDDLKRACELFGELTEVLENSVAGTCEKVLLCCTGGLTTTLLAVKMNEVAAALNVGYEFSAMPFQTAMLESADRYAAILLAPQVSHLRAQMCAVHPLTPVFQIPVKIFGSYDGAGAVRLVMHALRESPTQANELPPLSDLRLATAHRVLAITLFAVRGGSYLGYRLYEHGRAVLEGLVRKARVDLRDVEDLLETMYTRSIDIRSLDAIGIAVPGVTEDGVVRITDPMQEGFELGPHLEKRFGLPVFVDNNCNAAAAACYVTQNDYESVVFFRQELGHAGGGSGAVVRGHVVRGLHNFAGEPNHFVRRFDYSSVGSYDEARWSEEGMFEIAKNVSLAYISLVAPEALYLAVDTVEDMDKLASALAEEVGQSYVPHLEVVYDFKERVYVGEMALVERRLNQRGHLLTR